MKLRAPTPSNGLHSVAGDEDRETHAPLRILRRQQVEHATGLSRSTIYLRISQGLWTKPVNIGARAVGWPACEIEALNAARIANRTNDEVRELVVRLEERRLTADAPYQILPLAVAAVVRRPT